MAETSLVSKNTAETLMLQDRVAIVTSALRGIGKAITLHLASLSANLVINYTSNPSQADLVASKINNNNNAPMHTSPRAIIVKANVSDPEQVKSLFDATELAFNSLVHIMGNLVGIQDPKYPTVANTSIEEMKKVVQKFKNESPMDRLGKPKDVAIVVGFLAGDAGEWVNG